MTEVPRSSFIPKEASNMVPKRVRRSRTFHIFGFVATALLFGSVLAAGGSYFLEKAARAELASAQESLREQKGLFDPNQIAAVRDFDRRLRAAELLIKNHISPLKIFNALEQYTRQGVQFTSMTFEHTPASDATLILSGITEEFRILALQESSFTENPILKNVVFSQVSSENSASSDNDNSEESEARPMSGLAGTDKVAFSLKGVIERDLITYDGVSAPIETTDAVTSDSTNGAPVSNEGSETGPATVNEPLL